MSAPPAGPGSRGPRILLVAVMALAGVGFVVGIDDGVPQPDAAGSVLTAHADAARPVPAEAEGDANVLTAVDYRGLRGVRVGANADFVNVTGDLRAAAEPPEEPEAPEAKRGALERRAERRAYNGAPPVIPHEVEPVASDACLSCHEESVRLGDATAAGVPHPHLTNCQQCHVAASPLLEPQVLAESRFLGLEAPFEGDRAWTGAPPTIPHATWMRTECLSCHGPTGKVGMRTSHPERVNCLQCHAPSAELDQVAVGPVRFLSSAPE